MVSIRDGIPIIVGSEVSALSAGPSVGWCSSFGFGAIVGEATAVRVALALWGSVTGSGDSGGNIEGRVRAGGAGRMVGTGAVG